jgi:hypothetical protein
MGLDMYLSASLRTYKSYGKEKENKIRPAIRKALPEIFDSGNIEYIEIKFEAGYWRKANHIHKWFVDNVQDGEDDCREYCVSREQLQKLKQECQKILSIIDKKKEDINVIGVPNQAKKEIETILPTQEGFFFGGTEYDEWYIKDTKETIEIIDKCLKLPQEWSFDYHSSW